MSDALKVTVVVPLTNILLGGVRDSLVLLAATLRLAMTTLSTPPTLAEEATGHPKTIRGEAVGKTVVLD